MKIKRFTLLTLPALAFILGAIVLSGSSESRYFPRNLENESARSAEGYLEYMQMIKADRSTGEVSPDAVFAAIRQADRMPKAKASLNLNWSFQGPDNVGGRTRALLIDKNDPDHIYAGGVAGGVFESFDAAQTWQPYDPNFDVNNISCITQAVDGSVFVGTGGQFEGRGTSTDRGYFFIGTGVFKLTGNGTYEEIVAPTNRVSPVVDYATIGELAASPVDNDVLWIAMNNGLRKHILSTNSTVDYSSILGTSFSACNDIQISGDGQYIIATFENGKIFVSHDAGDNFTETTPMSGLGRIECAIAPSDKDIIYAAATYQQVLNDPKSTCLANIYRSRDGGINWEVIGPGGAVGFDMYAQPTGGNFGCQGNWDNMITVYPDNPGKILVGGVTLYRWEQSSVDPAPANGSWDRLDVTIEFNASGDRIPIYVHADKHAAAFDPRNSDVAYIATDGGITKSTNMNQALPTYTAHNYKYGVTQFYGMDVNGEGVMIAGSQDNGSQAIGLEFNNGLSAIEVLGGDGFDAQLSDIDTSIGISSLYYGEIYRVQGIGTTSGNSNFSLANVVNTNIFLSGYCNTRCSRVFYTVNELWESFNHEESTDSVDIDNNSLINLLNSDIIESLPPIALKTSIPFESNNNARRIQQATVNKYWPSVDKYYDPVIDTIPGTQLGILPEDTVSTYSGRFDTLLLNSANNQMIVNFDTFLVDTSNQTVQINLRASTTPNTVNYTLGTEYTYNSALIDSRIDIRFKVDTFTTGSQVGDSYLQVEDRGIRFRYLDTIRTGIYPFDTISATSGRFDTLFLRSNTTAVFNFDTISVDTLATNLLINRRGDSANTLTVPYTVGVEDSYNNLLLGANNIRFKVDTFDFGSRNGEPFLLIEEMNTRFRYAFKVQDKIQSMLALANLPGQSGRNERTIFMTRDLMKGNTDVLWHMIGGTASTPDPITSTILDMKFSNDGNHLFVGTEDGELFRISDLNEKVTTGLFQSSGSNLMTVINDSLAGKCNQIGNFPGRAVTDIAVDPNNSDNVIVSLGNYGNGFNVARIYNATTINDPVGNFDYIQGSGNTALPQAPAYAVMIDYNDPNKVLIGNELGVFATDNAFDTDPTAVQWTEENTGLGRVPVFEIKQMQFRSPYVKNQGIVYIATHGRGTYRADQLVGLDNINNNEVESSKVFKNTLRMFPNPVRNYTNVEFKIEDASSAVLVEIFNIRGQKVSEQRLSNVKRGKNTVQLNLSSLDRGTYIMRAIHNNEAASFKFIKQ